MSIITTLKKTQIMVINKYLLISLVLTICACQSPQKTPAVAHSLDTAIAEYENQERQQKQ